MIADGISLLRLRIDWSELDAFDHVNNVAFFKYTQAARIQCWMALGMKEVKNENGLGPVLVSATCQFRQPLFFPGDVVIESRLFFMKNTSFGMRHLLFNDKKELVAEAEDVVVLFDFNKNEKAPIPVEIREKAMLLMMAV